MTYGHSQIYEHNGKFENPGEMNVIVKIFSIWKNYKKKKLLGSFDEVRPSVFTLKKEIADKIKLKSERFRNKSKKRNYNEG